MSRLLAAAVAGLLLLVACGSSGGDSDLQAVAGAIREVETKGAGFTFTETLSRDEAGVTMLEYTILIGIITAAVIGSVAYAGTWVTGKWTALTAKLT